MTRTSVWGGLRVISIKFSLAEAGFGMDGFFSHRLRYPSGITCLGFNILSVADAFPSLANLGVVS